MQIFCSTNQNGKAELSSGFTLLELSAVLFLMAVLLGFSLPQFSNFLESDLEKESKKIAAVLDELRLQAILKNENYAIQFDTMKSEYSIFKAESINTRNYTPHEQFSTPIKLNPPVVLDKVSVDEEPEVQSRFGFEKLEFDKIFGQQFEFHIDSSGFIDQFTLKLKDQNNYIQLKVKNIMGDISIGQETPL